MVREWERDQAAAGHPTANAAEYDPVFKRCRWGSRRIHDRFVSVSALQRLQPPNGMEDRTVRVLLDELGPATILERVERVNRHLYGCGRDRGHRVLRIRRAGRRAPGWRDRRGAIRAVRASARRSYDELDVQRTVPATAAGRPECSRPRVDGPASGWSGPTPTAAPMRCRSSCAESIAWGHFRSSSCCR